MKWFSIAIMMTSLVVTVLLGSFAIKIRPLRWLSWRGPRRRPIESALAALGIALGASLTVGALMLGDSMETSIDNMKETHLGPVDVVFTFSGADARKGLERIEEALPRNLVRSTISLERTEGSVGTFSGELAANPERAEPDVVLAELDYSLVERFAGDGEPEIPPQSPSQGEIYMSLPLGRLLSVREGESVLVGLPRGRYQMRVARLLDPVGLAGFRGEFDRPPNVVWLPTGWMSSHPHTTQLLVSLEPGSGSLDERSQALLDALNPVMSQMDQARPRVSKLGAELEVAAQRVGSLMRRQLLQLGSFAGAASVALVIAIFSMVVADRRGEIGILRSTGMQRTYVGMEMAQEASLLGLCGVVLGIGIGALVTVGAASTSEATLNSVLGGVKFILTVRMESLAIGAGLAFLVGILAAAASTRRWTSMPPAAALRSLEEHGRPVRIAHVIIGVFALAFGLATAFTDLKYQTSTFSYLGPPIAIGGLALVMYQTQWAYVAMLIAAGASALWVLGIDIKWGGKAAGEGIFVVFGMAIVLVLAAAIAYGVVAPVLASRVTRLLSWMRMRAVTARLAAANLASSRMHSGFTVATCALVVLMPATIVTVFTMERADRSRMIRSQSGGWTGMIESRAADQEAADFAERIKAGPLGNDFNVVEEMPKARAMVHLVGAGTVSSDLYLISSEIAENKVVKSGDLPGAMLPLISREQDFTSDAAAWRALHESHPDGFPRAIVTAGVLPRGVDLRGAPVRIGESGRIVKIAGIAERNSFIPGIFVSRETLQRVNVAVDRRHALVEVAPDVDAKVLSVRFQGEYFGEGARMFLAEEEVDAQLGARTLLAKLLQSFLAVGLVVGVASLAVVMARSVRSRRHEIAVLRAVGVTRRGICLSVIGQSLGLTTTGIGAGALIGAYMGSRVFGAMSPGASKSVPWLALLGVFVVTLLITTAGAIVPAFFAARLSPAESLRDVEG